MLFTKQIKNIIMTAFVLTVVVDKSVIAYGGQDITDDVMKKITGK